MRNFNKLKIRIGFINTCQELVGNLEKNTVKILCLTAGLQLKMYGLSSSNNQNKEVAK